MEGAQVGKVEQSVRMADTVEGVRANMAAQGAQTAPKGEVNTMTKLGSMEELRVKEPELYRMIVEGMVRQTSRMMQRSQQRIKEMNRENNSR